MADKTYRTCQNCGEVNLNRDYCRQCGQIININLERRLQREKKVAEKNRVATKKGPNRLTLFFEKAREHDNILIKFTARFFYSIWVVVIAIGSFLALVFGYIAA